MNTPTPIWKTPAFWRELAAEWRGPLTKATKRGICYQIIQTFPYDGYEIDMAVNLLYIHKPETCQAYMFFPPGDRTSRAELCEKIANTLEKEQNETSGIQTSTQTTS